MEPFNYSQMNGLYSIELFVLNSNTWNNLCASNKKVKLVTVVDGDQKAPFSIATTPRF